MFEYILREIFLSVIAFLCRGRSVSRCICIRARDRSGAAHTSVQQDRKYNTYRKCHDMWCGGR